jgi:hypothetical protein
MKRHSLLPLLAFTGLLAASPLRSAEPTRLVAGKTSRLVLEGSSNVAGWRCQGTTLDGRMEVAAPLGHINAVIDRVEDGNIGVWTADPASGRFPQPTFELRVPVTTLRCGNGHMERDMYKALKSQSFPTIDFHFVNLVGGVSHDIDRGTYSARIAGVLSLAGSTRNITVEVEARRIARDRFRLQAKLPLRMTDFDITPPTALFGAIKADDHLLVRFDLMLLAGSQEARS